MKYIYLYTLFLVLACHTSCGQKQTELHKDNINYDIKDTITSYGPLTVVSNIQKTEKTIFASVTLMVFGVMAAAPLQRYRRVVLLP